MNFADLKRPVLVRMAHEQFGATIDPIHTTNALIVQSLESGSWVGSVVGKVELLKADVAPSSLTASTPTAATVAMPVGGTAVLTSPDLSQFIPSQDKLKSYHPRKLDGHTDIDVVERALRNGQNVLLIGDAGTGKNHLADAVAAKMVRPILTVSFADKVEPDELFGRYTYVHGVGTVWIDGVVTLAARYGAILQLDELNACPPGVSFTLHPLLDDRRFLVLSQKGNEMVRAHKDFSTIATMNADYRGTRPLNEAYRDRFDAPIVLDYDLAIERKLVKDMRLLKLATQLRESFRTGELTAPCSTRALIAYEKNLKLHGEHLAQDFFVNRYDATEHPAVRQAVELHLKSPDSKSEDALV